METYNYEYKELTNENNRIKDLIRKKYGYLNDEVIERLSDETDIFKIDLIDLIEYGPAPHNISEYVKLAITLNTSIDYIANLAIYDEPYEHNEISI